MGKTAREVMTGGAECVGENETLLDAARKLADLDAASTRAGELAQGNPVTIGAVEEEKVGDLDLRRAIGCGAPPAALGRLGESLTLRSHRLV
jgi:hypothetical protein